MPEPRLELLSGYQTIAFARIAFVCCSAWTNKLITAKDHAAVQINIGHLNEEGMYNGSSTTFAFSGSVRAMVRTSQSHTWEAGMS